MLFKQKIVTLRKYPKTKKQRTTFLKNLDKNNQMKKTTITITLLILVSFIFSLYGQCEENPLAFPTCDEASENILCDMIALTGFCSRMSSGISGGPQPSPLCPGGGTAHNISWLGFMAGQGAYTIRIEFFDCSGSSGPNEGVQVGVYTDCSFTGALYCDPTCTTSSVVIPSTDLIPGNFYYLFFDGCFGSVCSYEIFIDGNYSSSFPGLCNPGIYKPLTANTDWLHQSGGLLGSSTFWYQLEKDTIINNLTYQKIINPELPSFTDLYFREDNQERKVYKYIVSEDKEVLYYDFGLELGDEFIVPVDNEFNVFTVTKIEGVTNVAGIFRHKRWLTNENGLTFTTREGVGANHLDYVPTLFVSDPVVSILCTFDHCERLYGAGCEPNPRHAIISTPIVASICEGESFEGHTTTGIFSDTLSSIDGCDSIATLELTVDAAYMIDIDTTICDGLSYMGYSESGIYTIALITTKGCDSIVTVDLTIEDVEAGGVADIFFCDGDTLFHNDQIITSGGDEYLDTFYTIEGCIQNIVLISYAFFDHPNIFIDTTICEGESYKDFTTTGTYTLEVDAGEYPCDTIYHINLTVLPASDPMCISAVDNESNINISIGPNPANESITISSNVKIDNIKLLSVSSGSVVVLDRIYHSGNTTILTKDLTSGIYIMSISISGTTIYKKIIAQK